MKFLRWFKQDNSVILEFDHLSENDLEDFEEQISEVEKFYQFSRLEEIGLSVKNGRGLGLAAITFSNPRKSVLLRAIPILVGKKIPFTIFLRADCIGLNKLPPEEELTVFGLKYSEKLTPELLAEKREELYLQPERTELFLRALRTEVGPLPIDLIDPTLFFSTWGKLKEIPREWVEWGISLYLPPSKIRAVEDEILFMRQQLGMAPKVARVAKTTQDALWDMSSLQKLNLAACVTGGTGAVTRESHWWDLPYWRFST